MKIYFVQYNKSPVTSVILRISIVKIIIEIPFTVFVISFKFK